jgi:hypothetical protein
MHLVYLLVIMSQAAILGMIQSLHPWSLMCCTIFPSVASLTTSREILIQVSCMIEHTVTLQFDETSGHVCIALLEELLILYFV